MNKRWIIFIFILFICGCEEKGDHRPPTFPPPLVETPNSNEADQNKGQLAISREAMEIIAGIIQKPVDQITREDLLAIKHYVIIDEKDDLGSSFKALENLEDLYIYREVEDLSFIQDLPNLKNLIITINKTDTLEFLNRLEKLETLVVNITDSIDLRPLSSLKNLRQLEISSESTFDFAQLPLFESIEYLSIKANVLHNIDALKNFPTLKILVLSGVRYSGEVLFHELVNLEKLDIMIQDLDTIDFVTQLENLQILHIPETAVQDLTPLADAHNLKILNIMGTEVSDLTPLANLQQLQELYISRTNVTSIQPLLGLNNLIYIVLNKNKISDWELLSKAIPDLQIEDY